MIWAWFEEDDILARHGQPRLHTDDEGYFKDNFLWHLLIERLELEYWKLRKEEKPDQKTAVVEFARGTEHGGLREAFAHLSERFLEQAAVLYINVSFEESLRKNRRRFNPDKPHSILEHALPDEKLARLYGGSDWSDISASDPAYLEVGTVRVPYAVLENEDDVTTRGGELLGSRLRDTLDLLWHRYQALHGAAEPSGKDASPSGTPSVDNAATQGKAAGKSNPSSEFRIVSKDESHFAAHAEEMLIDRAEVDEIIRTSLAGASREGEVRIAVKHAKPVGYSGLKRVSLRNRFSFWAPRSGRDIPSHLVAAKRRRTRWLCVWGEWKDAETFMLHTFYPGKPAPREIHDRFISATELKAAVSFWATHAIIIDP
jgi:hypothetical protein